MLLMFEQPNVLISKTYNYQGAQAIANSILSLKRWGEGILCMKTYMAKGCRHVMPTGRNCHSPALKGMAYCHSHQKLHVALNRSKHSHNRLQLASIEEPGGIQLAIAQVCDALGKARIDKRKAHTLMYGLQLAAQLAPKNPKNDPSPAVREAHLDAQDS